MQVPSPLARYHHVLLSVSNYANGISLGDLVDVAQLPRSTTHRIATALCAVGYLTQNEQGAYVLGPALAEILRRSLVAGARSAQLQPALRFLVAELGETAFFAHLVDKRIDLIEAVTPVSPDRSYVHPGIGERPVDTCSSSKAILAFADEATVRSVFDSSELASGSQYDWLDFNAALRKVERDGYAICDGEIDEGVFSIACPVPVGHLHGLFSIGVTGPRGRIKKVKLEKMVRLLHCAADLAATGLTDNIGQAR